MRAENLWKACHIKTYNDRNGITSQSMVSTPFSGKPDFPVSVRKISLIASMLAPSATPGAYRFSKLLICVMAKMTKSAPRHYTNYGYTNYEFHKTLEAVKNITYVSNDPKFSSGNIQNSLFASSRDIAIFRSEIHSQPPK